MFFLLHINLYLCYNVNVFVLMCIMFGLRLELVKNPKVTLCN